MLHEITERFNKIVTVEENSVNGGFGCAVQDFLDETGYTGNVLKLGIPDRFIPHGSRQLLLKEIGLDEDGIYRSIMTILKPRKSILDRLHLKRNGKRPTDLKAETESSDMLLRTDKGSPKKE
jgi:1-deoxy-D-xylulose-5-phosphate synthase